MSEADEQQYGVSRLISFSDGVFGVSITLLITTIPTSLSGISSSTSHQQVFAQLATLLPNFYSYAFSFFMVGSFWLVHHRLFQRIVRYDATLMWLNLTLLLFIVFLPVPTAFLGRYGGNSVIVALYGATLALISLIYMILNWHALTRPQIIDPPADTRTIRYELARGFITISFFVLSVGIAFLNPDLAKYCWLALLIVRPRLLSHSQREAPETSSSEAHP